MSIDPVSTPLSSGVNLTARISFSCPFKIVVVLNVFKSQILAVLSHDPETKYFESDDKSNDETKWLWPVNDLNGFPTR